MSVTIKGAETVGKGQFRNQKFEEATNTADHAATKQTISPVLIAKFLLLISLLLLICHLVVVHLGLQILELFRHSSGFSFYETVYYTFYSQFHLALDGNIPTYFSSINLAIASFLLFVIHFSSTKSTNHWLYLSFLFLFLSVDESAQIHETLGGIAGEKATSYLKAVPPFLKWAWMVPYSVLTMAIGLYFFRFTLKLPAFTRNLFYLSGGTFVFAALILEFFESHFDTVYGPDNLMNQFLFPLEEIMEMVGVIIFIYALLDYLMLKNKVYHLAITNKK